MGLGSYGGADHGTCGAYGASCTLEPEAFDWRRYEGESIRILLWNHPAVDYWEEHLQEFKDLTGIDVVWDKVDVWEVYPKTLLELTAAPDQVDVVSLVPP